MLAGVTKTYVANEGEDGIGMKGEDDNINDMGQYNTDDDPFINYIHISIVLILF